jgi:cytochrome P450
MTEHTPTTLTDAVDLPTYPQPRSRTCPFAPAADVRALSAEQPIRKVRFWDGSTPWLVTGPDELRTLLTNPHVSADDRTPGVPQWSPAEAKESLTRPATYLNTDGLEQTRYRRMVARSLSFKNANALLPVIQQHTDDCIDAMLAGPSPVDLVPALALPVPTLTICALLGVPYEDHSVFQRNAAIGLDRNSPVDDAQRAMAEIFDYVREFVRREMDHPTGADTICAEIAEQVSAGAITFDTGTFMAASVLGGGFETTANMIALGTLAFLEHPDQAAIVRDTDEPQDVAHAVEEMLRYLAVAHASKCRVALEDIDIAGHTIHAGDGIVQGYPYANWDTTAFPEPERFDVRRPQRNHLAFGAGPHSCIGQQLARVELQVVYATLLRRIPTLRLATPIDQLQFKNDTRAYGVYTLPVTW